MTATAIASRGDRRGVFPPGAATASAVGGGGHAVAGPGVPVVVLAAAVLAADGVLLLVGSAALRLRGEPVTVADADVVIEPGAQNVRCLHSALAGVALRPRDVPPPNRLAGLPVVTIRTSYGRVDCLLERGRRDWGSCARAPVRWRWLT